jgi:hypothetical protein
VHVIVGAHGDDGNGNASGAAYVFERCVSTFVACSQAWFDRGKLIASDAAEGDFFGFSVAIDGDYAIIGAYLKGIASDTSEGAAYVFERSGDTWTETDKLTTGDAADGDHFGFSVSIGGNYAIISAFSDDLAGKSKGSAYAFKSNGDAWTEVGKLTASDAADFDFFGKSVAISGDYAIIGAADSDLTGTSEGSAYVFRRSGDTWVEIAKLTANDAAELDFFGESVAISGDYAIIGAFWDDLTGTDEGSAYIFVK